MATIDAHVHFIWPDKRAHHWPDGVGNRLDRDFTPADLTSELAKARIDGVILVQSLNDLEETAEYLALAAEHRMIFGVVGWVPLDDPAQCSAALERFSGDRNLVGIRHLIAYEPDPKWLLRPQVLESLGLLARAGLAFEAIPVNQGQFESTIEMAGRVPELEVVINHLGRPPVAEQGWQPWADLVEKAAINQNVTMKLSVGLHMAVNWKWSTDALRRYVDFTLEHFGPDRMLAASNWPVIILSADYSEVWQGLTDLVAGLSENERRLVIGGTAERVFRLSL
jgi:L-fuconolactonase